VTTGGCVACVIVTFVVGLALSSVAVTVAVPASSPETSEEVATPEDVVAGE
jgi:hypothetical protein